MCINLINHAFLPVTFPTASLTISEEANVVTLKCFTQHGLGKCVVHIFLVYNAKKTALIWTFRYNLPSP